MLFVFRMLLRELRSSWKRLFFFFLCVAIGVGGIVSLRSVIQIVRVSLLAEARTLTAADVYLRSEQVWTEDVRAKVAGRLRMIPNWELTETVDLTTMARVVEDEPARTKVVEVRGVQPGFPFYGLFELGSGEDYSFELLRNNGALVAPELLAQLGLGGGDRIELGDATFEIRGVIVAEPGRQLGGFSFGPRVLVAHDALNETGLLTFASRASRQLLLRIPDESEIDTLVETLEGKLSESFVRVGSYRSTEGQIERNLKRTEDYLSLLGFVVVVLGGIGVWSVTRVFVQQRLRSVAILRCLGATTARIMTVYVLQVAMLGLGGSVLGIGVAQIALWSVPHDLSEQVFQAAGLGTLSMVVTLSAVLQGLGVGILVSLLFALVPLLDIRHAKPLLLLRQGKADERKSIDWFQFAVVIVVGACLILVASWQASSLEIGAYVVGGFTLVAGALHLLGRGLILLVQPLQASTWFPLRHAVLNLTRSGNQTRVILLSVGLGSFFIIGVELLQSNLLNNFALELREDSPDMFLIDVQEDQAVGVRAVLEGSVDGVPKLLPVLRARVIGVDGERLQINNVDEARLARLGREYTVTYRSQLEENERIVSGEFWGAGSALEPEVSVEERLQTERGISVGDLIRFDVLGRYIEARVTSVRVVDWDDSRSGGFMFVFRPGSLEGAPHSYITFVKGPAGREARAQIQREISTSFPNVSVIDGLDVIRTVRRVLGYVTMSISVVGGLALFSGTLILIGAVAMTKFQRLYESAIFKTLGANTRLLASMLALEYGLLGILAGSVGSVGALSLSWVLARQVFEVSWFVSPGTSIGGVLLTGATVCIVGVMSSIDVIRRKPLLTLRAE